VHLLPVLFFSIPAFLRLIDGAGSRKQLVLIGWTFGFGLNLAGLYWITEPILTEVSTFWWLVPFAAPLLAFAVAFYSVIPAFAARLVRPGLGRLLVFASAWVFSDLLRQFAFSACGVDRRSWADIGDRLPGRPAAFRGARPGGRGRYSACLGWVWRGPSARAGASYRYLRGNAAAEISGTWQL
jgi:apolipoprotein N-acyltransferase